jgi:hypothetical protein
MEFLNVNMDLFCGIWLTSHFLVLPPDFEGRLASLLSRSDSPCLLFTYSIATFLHIESAVD